MIFEMKRLLYQTNADSTLHIYPIAPYALSPDAIYTAWIRPATGYRTLEQAKKGKPIDPDAALPFASRSALTADGGALRLPIVFPQEDQYALTLYMNGQETDTLFVLALDEDLFSRLPYKGNLHLHSFYSDGTESPEQVAARGRMLGLDFVAVSDPMQYAPSKRAASFLAPPGIDFLVLRGEEIQVPESPFPIIAVGHQAGIEEWRRKNIGHFESEVEKKQASIGEPLPERLQYAIAASIVMLEKITEQRGVSILSLPARFSLDTPFDIIDYLFGRHFFDAFELIGDMNQEETQQMISYYQERPAYPVVGGSRENVRDGAPRYTIAFAQQLTPDSILQAVRDGYTVAGIGNALHGPFRLVRAAYFFARHIFPRHDALCAAQGSQLVAYASGKAETDPDFSDQFGEIGDIVSEYYKGLKG